MCDSSAALGVEAEVWAPGGIARRPYSTRLQSAASAIQATPRMTSVSGAFSFAVARKVARCREIIERFVQ